ncbi:tetratricopeptide repeat protein [Archangium gephyra]|uniref:tetratricopeptide repeat protein n=1 Tax=Archangium gephyra TaxID=48 RepID=UPI0035D4BFDC
MTSTPAPSREALCGEAHARPLDARAQIAAAYACDRDGVEEEAVVFYDAAWKLGVPSEQRAEFLIGYGSTLKNVGRLDESLRILGQAITDGAFPSAARAFLALTLQASGRSPEAIAELLSLLLEVGAQDAGLIRYRRSLAWYADQLRASAEPGPEK